MNRILVLGLIMLMAAAGGCQFLESSTAIDEPDQPPADNGGAVMNLDSPTGGFTESDEEPAFGETQEFESFGGERMYNDALADDEYVKNLEQNRFADHPTRIFRLRSIWGHLAMAARDTADVRCCRLDWSGGMHFEGGIIIVERLIAFEATDYLARIDRSTIEWVSHTCPGADGIQVRLIVSPPPVDTASAGLDPGNIHDVPRPSLTIKAGSFSRTFTLEELGELDLLYPVDRCGNAIMVVSREIRPDCPNGYLWGKFMAVDPDTLIDPDTQETRGIILARFKGIWMSEHGWYDGYLRGVAGINSEGEKVFFGKYISYSGRFRGIIRGKYGMDPVLSDTESGIYPGTGWFDGEWLGRNAVHLGFCKGNWISDEDTGGFFKGVWGMRCVTVD